MNRQPHYPASVLVDSGAWAALSNVADRNHAQAVTIRRSIERGRSRLFVTNFLIDETYTLMLARIGYQFATRFLDGVYASAINRLRVTPDDEAKAEDILRRYSDKRFSYTDATSFVIMDRLGIEAVFTFDHNFAEYGKLPILSQ